MSDHRIGQRVAVRSTSTSSSTCSSTSTKNRLLEAMNEIMAPLFPLTTDRPTAGCDGRNKL